MQSIILIGFGTVGKSIVRIFQRDRDYFESEYHFHPSIVAICEKNGCLLNESGLDLEVLIANPDLTQSEFWQQNKETLDVLSEVHADIVVECTWTNPQTGEPALSHIKTALEQGMHIVFSNKGPFYLDYNELKDLANSKGLIMGIGATVGSGIPDLAAKRTLAGAHIKSIRAILNGTSNYILSRMTSENLSFELALKEAQDLGYAEADPTLDIEGYDAAGKIVILANELMGWNKNIHDVDIQGITQINHQAIELAKKSHYVIKHLGIAEDGNVRVGPILVPENSQFAINGSLNIIEIDTQNAGPIVFSGRGAGGLEAASGIISDIINVCTQKQLQ